MGLRTGETRESRRTEVTEVVLWRVDGAAYALPLASVVEVTPVVAITRKAGASGGEVSGWFNLRGATVPVLEPSRIFRRPASPASRTDRFIIVSLAGASAALPVDEVVGVVEVEATPTVDPVPFRPARQTRPAGEAIVQLIDPDIAFPALQAAADD